MTGARAHIVALTACIFTASLLNACGPQRTSGPTKDTYVEVPDRDWALWDSSGKQLTYMNSGSVERSSATKLTYKSSIFYPQEEQQRMEKAIANPQLHDLINPIEGANYRFTRLHDGRILGSGGSTIYDKSATMIALVDPANRHVVELPGLHVPRADAAVVQLKDGRVIFIGGETTDHCADDGTDNLTNTVEEFDLESGNSKIIGRMLTPRHGVIAEVIADRDILIVGGWHERTSARDERWWSCAEIFRVPPRQKKL